MLLSQIRINPNNPRIIKDYKFKKLCDSIREFPKMMELRPMVIDEHGVVLGGNMRLKALKFLGYTDIPDAWVKSAKDLTETEIKKFIILDNASFGEWDLDLLLQDWTKDELSDMGLDLEWPKEINEADDDNFNPDLNIQTDIKRGDLIEFIKGNKTIHKLLCGDATSQEDSEKLFNKKQFDLIVTDPPYNVDYAGKNDHIGNFRKGKNDEILNDKMPDKEFYQFLVDFNKNFINHCKPGGAWYVWHADSIGHNQRNSFLEAGLLIKQNLVWVKNTIVMGRQDYQWQHEPCLYGWKPGAGHYFIPFRNERTIFDDSVDFKKLSKDELLEIVKSLNEVIPTTVLRENKPHVSELHPTMKPVKLIGRLIINSSRPGEIVADAFLGSGTTMVAAHQLNRRCYGMELDPQYCQVIIDRMRKLDPGITIKKNGEVYNG